MKWFVVFLAFFIFLSCTSNKKTEDSFLKSKSHQKEKSGTERSEPLLILPPYEVSFVMDQVKVLYFKEKKLSYFQMFGLIKIGSKDDPPHQKGMSYLLTKMLNTGSKEAVDLAFEEKKQELGMSLSVSVDKTTISFSCSTISVFELEALRLCLSPLINPHFSKEVFDREKARLLEALSGKRKDPSSAKDIAWNAWYYGEDYPQYAHLPMGQKNDIKNITLKSLKNFHLKNITLNKLSLSLISPHSKDGLLEVIDVSLKSMVENYSKIVKYKAIQKNKLKIAKKVSRRSLQTFRTESTENIKPKIFFIYGDKSLVQSYFTFSHRLWELKDEPSDRDKVGLSLLNRYLSGGDSLLMGQIREVMGLTYHIGSRMLFSRHISSDFSIVTYTANKEKNVKSMITEVLKTLREGRKKGITEDQFQSARNRMFVILALSLVENLGAFAENVLHLESGEGWFEDKRIFYKYLDYVDSFDARQLNELFRKYLHPKELKVFVYGPKSLEDDLRSIGSVTMKPIDEFF